MGLNVVIFALNHDDIEEGTCFLLTAVGSHIRLHKSCLSFTRLVLKDKKKVTTNKTVMSSYDVKGVPEERQQNGESNNVDNAEKKEEIDFYTPGLILTRKIFLWAYALGTIGVLIAAIALIATMPKRCPKERTWYTQNVMYKVYVPSFKDSDGDGIGDLPGIMSKLDYIAGLNVKTLWLSSLYDAPTTGIMPDAMDSNFTAVDPKLGTTADLKALIRAVHAKKMKLMLDFIPTATSNNNSWFMQSRASRDNPKSNWYVWENPYNGGPPRVNWSSTDNNNVHWQYDTTRQQYYMYYDVKERPELNFKSSSLRAEIKSLFSYYLKLGVDAFNIYGMEWHFGSGSTVNGNVRPSFSVLSEWNTQVAGYTDAKYTFLVGQVPNDVNAITISQSCKFNALYLLTYSLLPNNGPLTGKGIANVVSNWITTVSMSSPNRYPHWMLRNEAKTRVAQSFGRQYVNALNFIMMTLPGVPSTYYGEEIGMMDSSVTYAETRDPLALIYGPVNYDTVSQDKARGPMSWNSTANADFTNGTTTWLPLASDYTTVNVNSQTSNTNSNLDRYKNITSLRSTEDLFKTGNYSRVIATNEVFAFRRYSSAKTYSVMTIANVGAASQTIDIKSYYGTSATTGSVLAATESSRHAATIQLNSIQLASGEAVVLKIDNA